MQQALIVGRQVLLILIYVGAGMICTKTKILNETAGRGFSALCLNLVLPALILKSLVRPFDIREAKGFAMGFFLAILFHVIAAALAVPLIQKRADVRYRMERLAVVFSNCGYMAVPLIRAASGETGVFYALGYICVFNIALWTLGYMLMTETRKPDFRKILLNPGLISTLIGLVIYIAQIPLPGLLLEATAGIAAFNTPLSMLTIGIFLAGIHVRRTVASPRIYFVALLRLIVLPVFMLLLLKLLRADSWTGDAPVVLLSVSLGCACPCAAAVTLFPVKFGLEGDYGAEMIAVTTLFSIITLPVITLIAGALF